MSIPNPSNPMFWIVVALIVAYFGVDYIGLIPAALRKLWSFAPGSPAVAPATPADLDVSDLAALKVVRDRNVRLKCEEGQAAVAILFQHFFHEAE